MFIKKDTQTTGIPIYQGKNTEVAQGGFTLNDPAFSVENTVIPAGSLIGFDESTRTAKVAKIAVAQAASTASATTYKVLKGHKLAVGMLIKSGSASVGQAITAIDTTNADYDLLTVGTTIGVSVAVGAAIFVDDEGYKNLKGLLYSDATIKPDGTTDIAVVLRGIVYARRIQPVPATIKANLPLIIFSQSF